MARYAVILKETGEVADIKIMEGDTAPEINGDVADKYEVVKVGGGVMIGMVKGGPNNAADGYGFPEGTNIGDRHGTGATRIADSKGKVDESALPPTSHEKVRADEVGKTASKNPTPAATAPKSAYKAPEAKDAGKHEGKALA
jgi:hypothetical protein